jgi:hypothetical protein
MDCGMDCWARSANMRQLLPDSLPDIGRNLRLSPQSTLIGTMKLHQRQGETSVGQAKQSVPRYSFAYGSKLIKSFAAVTGPE